MRWSVGCQRWCLPQMPDIEIAERLGKGEEPAEDTLGDSNSVLLVQSDFSGRPVHSGRYPEPDHSLHHPGHHGAGNCFENPA